MKCNALVGDTPCPGSTSRTRWGRWSWAAMVDPEVALDAEHALPSALSSDEVELARSPDVAAEPQAVPDERNIPGTLLRLVRERHVSGNAVGSRGLSGLRARLKCAMPPSRVGRPPEGRCAFGRMSCRSCRIYGSGAAKGVRPAEFLPVPEIVSVFVTLLVSWVGQ